ncbi:MAG: DUF3987 domain-containing protein [Phycisphaerae bacterium]|nr:DUF3987 domain-containing protein [Phycisphaerae bacterium]
MSVSRILAALENVTGQKPVRNGNEQWQSRCPAHDDRNPSLSIGLGDDGRVLLHCQAGCTVDQVVTALGLTQRDLFNGNGKPASSKSKSTPRCYPSVQAAVESYAQWKGGAVEDVYRYNDDYHRARIKLANDKTFCELSRTSGGWTCKKPKGKTPLYRRDKLSGDGMVFVVEGEKCVHAAESIGLVATTSGSSSSASRADWGPLAGRDVVVFPDHDGPGMKHAQAVTAELHRLDPAATVRVVELPGLGDGEDLHDFINEHRDSHTADDIRAEIEALVAVVAVTDVVESDHPDHAIEPYQPFPVDALPEPIRAFVKAVAAATGTDSAFAAMAALVVAAGCIGNRVSVLVKSGWTEPAVLWGVLVGRSGTTKSPVLKLVTRALVELFKAERLAHRDALKEHQRAIEHHGVHLTKWKKSQRNGPPTDPPDEPERPIERRLLVSDITIEKLGCLLEENPLGLLLVRDELAAWVGAFDRYASGGKGSDQPAWLSMYDAAPVTIDRKSGRGTYFVERSAVSVLGTTQPSTLSRIFGTAEREAGLLARVLLAYPPDRPALWTEAALSDDVAGTWRDLLAALLALPAGVDDVGDPRPRFIPIGKDARALWVEWHDRHARELVDIGNDDLAAHYAKLKGACARIALLFACVEMAAGGDAGAYIGADAMRRAIDVTEWFKSEGRRVYAVLSDSDEGRERQQLVEWIERRGGSLTIRELTHGVYRYRSRSNEAKAALDELVKAGHGSWEYPRPGPQGGRPSRRFTLNEQPPPGEVIGNIE